MYPLAVVLVVLLSQPTSPRPALVPPPSPSECGRQHAKHLARAASYEEDGKPTDAADAYRAALATPCFEVPNYRATLHLARAFCDAGEADSGTAALRDLDCMLAVDLGEMPCYLKDPTHARNPQLTNACFRGRGARVVAGQRLRYRQRADSPGRSAKPHGRMWLRPG